MPALRLMERILGKEPKFVLFDDNKAMISVVRSGKNLTMRHLERSHGVAVTWMHDMFERDYMYLAYEVTDRMAADPTETCVCANRIAGAGNVDRPGNPQDGHIFF